MAPPFGLFPMCHSYTWCYNYNELHYYVFADTCSNISVAWIPGSQKVDTFGRAQRT